MTLLKIAAIAAASAALALATLLAATGHRWQAGLVAAGAFTAVGLAAWHTRSRPDPVAAHADLAHGRGEPGWPELPLLLPGRRADLCDERQAKRYFDGLGDQ